MGIFDGYKFGDSNQGSLIDRLFAQLGVGAQSQQFGSGLQTDQAQYGSPITGQNPAMAPAPLQFSPTTQQANAQPSPLDNAQWPYGPNGAPSQANAQMAPQLPMQPTQQQDALPAALQPYQSPGGIGAAFRGMAANAQAGPLGMLMGGIGGAMGMGQGTDQEHANRTAASTYRALVPILGEQKATLAILNPEMGKAMVEQALKGKQYTFTTTPEGTVLRQDAHTGTAEPVYTGAAKPTFGVIKEEDGKKTYGWQDPNKRSVTPYQAPGDDEERGTVTGPDGKPITIPPGVDRKTFVNEISKANAKAAAGEMTGEQAKATIYASKMELAEKNLRAVGEDQLSSYKGRALDGAPAVGNTAATNWMQSDKYQQAKQARDNFITALLRQESGAAIGKDEFTRYEKEMFPQPGDGAGVIAQKREARRVAIEGMRKGAGPSYKSPNLESGGDGAPKADPLGIR